EDFYISGASRQSGALYFQTQTGFELSTNQPWENNIKNEELGSVFIDFDNDDDLDLYVVNGSNEGLSEQDVLYINDGKGNFAISQYFDIANNSGQVVKAFDYDNDGWMDLF